jgi:metal-dependent hydrolase (beta-lactamase superfamily II)
LYARCQKRSNKKKKESILTEAPFPIVEKLYSSGKIDLYVNTEDEKKKEEKKERLKVMELQGIIYLDNPSNMNDVDNGNITERHDGVLNY